MKVKIHFGHYLAKTLNNTKIQVKYIQRLFWSWFHDSESPYIRPDPYEN